MKIKTKKTELEKQPDGVFSGVRIIWNRDSDFDYARDWLHGAAMCQPWSRRGLADDLFFLSDLADTKFRMQRDEARAQK